MFKPDWSQNPDAFLPIDIVDATLTELMFQGFGVTLGGSGSLTFDGFPTPEGKVGFQTTGANALIDRLTTSIPMPAEDLSFRRVALALIAQVGGTSARLVSNLAFRDKAFYLNGQKLR